MADDRQNKLFLKQIFYPLALGSDGNHDAAAAGCTLDQIDGLSNDEIIDILSNNAWSGYTELAKLVYSAQKIYDVMKDQLFEDVDSEMQDLASIVVDNKNANGVIWFRTVDDVAGAIVFLIDKIINKNDKVMVWKTPGKDKGKVERFKKTAFGKKLLDAELIVGKGPSARSKLGPLAKELRGLLSQFDENGKVIKTFIKGSDEYVVCDKNIVSTEKNKHKTVGLIIQPRLTIKGSSKYQGKAPDSNKVFSRINDNFDQVMCSFETQQEAAAFKDAAQNSGQFPNAAFAVARRNVDPNGYLKVKTDFGDCLIRASGFNEEFELDNDGEVLTETANIDLDYIDESKNYINMTAVEIDEAYLKKYGKTIDQVLKSYNTNFCQ